MSSSATLPVRILIIDDHAIMRTGLRLLLENQPNFVVVGEAANGQEALALAKQAQPDIILLDLMLGNDNGLELLPQLTAAANQARVLVLTGVNDPGMHRRAITAGAMGLVLKEQASQILLKAIARVQAGEVWLDQTLMAAALSTVPQSPPGLKSDPEAAKIAQLTAREREVIALIGERLKNKQIAERLFVSEATVRHHLTSIFSKLEINDRLELMIYAYHHNLAQPPQDSNHRHTFE